MCRSLCQTLTHDTARLLASILPSTPVPAASLLVHNMTYTSWLTPACRSATCQEFFFFFFLASLGVSSSRPHMKILSRYERSPAGELCCYQWYTGSCQKGVLNWNTSWNISILAVLRYYCCFGFKAWFHAKKYWKLVYLRIKWSHAVLKHTFGRWAFTLKCSSARLVA